MRRGPASGEGGERSGRTGRLPGTKAPRGLFCQQKGSTRRCRAQHLRAGLAGPHRRGEGRGGLELKARRLEQARVEWTRLMNRKR